MKPADVFDREVDWRDLERFTGAKGAGLRIGIVSGRRRVGKSYLLRRLATGGIYHQALEEERGAAISRVGNVIAARTGLAPGSVHFDDWLAALRALVDQAGARSRGGSRVVVLDELPYLLQRSGDVLSALQLLYDERRSGPPVSLLLCGSSLSIMTKLLAGSQPLRGRASLDLRLAAFDFRVSRAHWSLRDPHVAVSVDAVLGGAPGYLDLVGGDRPTTPDDLGPWLAATVLNPSHALYREDEFLLREDPRMTDRALYQSILGAVAAGERTPSRIGARIGRDRTAMSALLANLVDAGFLRRDVDLVNPRAVTYVVADPILRFARLVTAPRRPDLDERRADRVWAESQATWRTQVVGPHVEDIARSWLQRYASPATLGGQPVRIARYAATDPATRTKFELDAAGVDATGRRLFLCEVKSGLSPRSVDDLDRLERLRDSMGAEAATAKLLLVSAGGFDRAARQRERRRDDVELVDLARLYESD